MIEKQYGHLVRNDSDQRMPDVVASLEAAAELENDHSVSAYLRSKKDRGLSD